MSHFKKDLQQTKQTKKNIKWWVKELVSLMQEAIFIECFSLMHGTLLHLLIAQNHPGREVITISTNRC